MTYREIECTLAGDRRSPTERMGHVSEIYDKYLIVWGGCKVSVLPY